MTNYKQLVKALRYCKDDAYCSICSRYEQSRCYETLFEDAAAAIEELQQIADHHEQTAKDYWKEACEYKAQLPKRGEWIVKGANRIDCSVCGHSVCFAFGLSDGSFDLYKYCPECGAKMEVQE